MINERLFSIGKDGTIHRNYRPQPINHQSIKEETDLLVERLVESNILEPNDQYESTLEDINPDDHFSPKDLKAWVDYLISHSLLPDLSLDSQLAALKLICGRNTEFDFDMNEGITIKPKGSVVISPYRMKSLMVDWYLSLRDSTPVLVSKQKIMEHLGGISLSSLNKLQKIGLPHCKYGPGGRRVGFNKTQVNNWLKLQESK